MVGIVGTIGDIAALEPDRHLRWSQLEQTFAHVDPPVHISGTDHVDRQAPQPASALEGDVQVWVVGEVYGSQHDSAGDSEYATRSPSVDSSTFCAQLYTNRGIDFLEGLNGSFLVILHDARTDTVLLATDRLGSIPLFVVNVPGGIIFSTSIQTVCRHPAFEPRFNVEYLHEYLVFKRSFGVTTPIEGVQRLTPGSVMAVNIADYNTSTRSYWHPTYRPRSESFEYFVERFIETFTKVIDEWTTASNQSYGLLLSGGSDSRLCLASFPKEADVLALHMSGWMSREARMAEWAALTAGVDFRWLRRDASYQRRALERNPRIANFNGWFSQAYVTGFHDTIVDEVDILVSGLYADTLFKGHAIPSPVIDLGALGEFELPIESSIQSIEEYIDWLLDGASDELSLPTDIREVLASNIAQKNDGIEHHGVWYPSIDNLVQCASWYPLSNDDDMIFRDSLHHLRPYRTPYLDNRLIDLALEMPRRYHLRRNIVNRGLQRLSPDLADIPHSNTGIRPARGYSLEYIGKVIKAFWYKHIGGDRPPRRFLSNGPWIDDAELIRTDSFVEESIDRNQELIRGLPFLELANVRECYDRHLDGENRIVELYGLLSLLEMPITQNIGLAPGGSSPPMTARPRQRSVARPIESGGRGDE